MKHIILAAAAALALGACGGSGGDPKAKMVKACLESGEGTEAQCGCVADKLEEGVGEREFAKLADFAAKGDDTGAQEYMNEIMGANPQMAMTLGMSMMGCMAL